MADQEAALPEPSHEVAQPRLPEPPPSAPIRSELDKQPELLSLGPLSSPALSALQEAAQSALPMLHSTSQAVASELEGSVSMDETSMSPCFVDESRPRQPKWRSQTEIDRAMPVSSIAERIEDLFVNEELARRKHHDSLNIMLNHWVVRIETLLDELGKQHAAQHATRQHMARQSMFAGASVAAMARASIVGGDCPPKSILALPVHRSEGEEGEPSRDAAQTCEQPKKSKDEGFDRKQDGRPSEAASSNQGPPWASTSGGKQRSLHPGNRKARPSGHHRFGSTFLNIGSLFHHDNTVELFDGVGREPKQTDDSQQCLAGTGCSSAGESEHAGKATHSQVRSPYSVVSRPMDMSQLKEAKPRDTTQQSRLQTMVVNPYFDLCSGGIVIFNSVMIGIETEYMARDFERTRAFFALQMFFNAWYLIELILRLVAEGSLFFLGLNWRWNIMDFSLVSLSVVEAFVEIASDGGWAVMSRLLRSLRVLRVVRTLRIVRMLRYVREFRKMIFSITASLHTLFWSLFLLGVLMYMFAVFLTQGVAEFVNQSRSGEVQVDPSVEEQLVDSFGNLATSMYSLYASIAGGVSWIHISWPLYEVHWVFLAFFLVFISLSIFGVLNVLTSVFVESAMSASHHYRDLLIQEQMHDKELYARHMREVLIQIDVDGSGLISSKELDAFLLDPNLRLYLEALDLNLVETRCLFLLLDRDGSGEVDIDEFCEGCLRLKGNAKAFDIHCLLYESQRMLLKWKDFMKFVEEQLGGCFENVDGPSGEPSLVDGHVPTASTAIRVSSEN